MCFDRYLKFDDYMHAATIPLNRFIVYTIVYGHFFNHFVFIDDFPDLIPESGPLERVFSGKITSGTVGYAPEHTAVRLQTVGDVKKS